MYKIGSVVINALKDESINFTNEVTSKAVEDGSEVADNINHKPLRLSATCVLSGEDADQRYQLLKRIANEDQLLTYYGHQEPLLDNMAIESIGVKRDVSYGDGFEFSIDLVQVKVATLKTYNAIQSSAVESKVKSAGKVQVQTKTISAQSVKDQYLAKKLERIYKEA
jgi:hypothetical protein